MASNFQQKALRKEAKQPQILLEDSNEYKRVKYSLKLALRMVNIHLDNFTLYQYNQPHGFLDEEAIKQQMTSVECWYKPQTQQEADVISQNQRFQWRSKSQVFTVGSIIEKATDLPLDQTLSFFLFKVVIGRAFVKRGRKTDAPEQCQEGYDSVYLEDSNPNTSFSHHYAIFNQERVTLIHKVVTQIKVHRGGGVGVPKCISCDNTDPKYFCLADKEYFCEEDWVKFHSDTGKNFLAVHEKVDVEQRPKEFGQCKKHKRIYEYYNEESSHAFCSQCIVEGAHKIFVDVKKSLRSQNTKQSQLIPITKAYQHQVEEALKEDPKLEEKRKKIEENLRNLRNKMTKIKDNAVAVQGTITQILENTLLEMQQLIQKKSEMLKSDRQELHRQYQEILFISAFIKEQSIQASPLEFLILHAGHSQIKEDIRKQQSTILELTDEKDYDYLKVTQKPIIVINESNNQMKDTQNIKQQLSSVTDKARGKLDNTHLQQNQKANKHEYSTKFRDQLFQRQGSTIIFRQNQQLQEVQSKIPNTLHLVQTSKQKELTTEDSQGRINKMLLGHEKKVIKYEFQSIVNKSIQSTIFGYFGENYKRYTQQLNSQESNDTNTNHFYLKFFQQSNILQEEFQILRTLLYFNLPYEEIIQQQLVPDMVFSHSTGGLERSLSDLIEKIEEKKTAFKYHYSILLVRIDYNPPLEDEDQNQVKQYIVGGFANENWQINSPQTRDKRPPCFLFNLTQDLRFNARDGMPFYQRVTQEEMSFGTQDFVIRKNFNSVYSRILKPTSDQSGSHFGFSDDLNSTSQVNSIIIPASSDPYVLKKIELWMFKKN